MERDQRMKHVSLGGLDVSRLGLGCMGMSGYYTGAGADHEESIRTIRRLLELGITFLDTALAWVLAQGDDVVPISGSKLVSRLEENAAAKDVELTADQLARLAAIPAPVGDTYADMSAINR
jgi:aryl-alcohol dehydrogenase-like predicted oxidoreductase